MMFRNRSLALAVTAIAIGVAGAGKADPALPPSGASLPTSSTSSDNSCSALAGMKVEAGTVESAESYASGKPIVAGATAGAIVATDLCRARIRLQPVPGSEIQVEVWLPESWNKKFMGLGGGGFDGSLSPGGAVALNKAVSQGYAAVATDVGHTPAPSVGSWVHKQPEKVVDFGHRGNHLAAVVAKQVVAAYYGTPIERSYFVGCSNGGRDGIMEASRYPEDYDGIVAGSPALRYVEVVTQLIWNSRAVHGPNGAPNLSGKLKLVHDAIIRKCDGLDGVRDGILENPRLCRFDPEVLQCRSGDGPACLNANEVAGFRKVYGGLQLSNGQRVYSGPALGSEGVEGNWDAWVTGLIPGMAGQEFYRWMVYDDPNWKIEDFDFDRDYPVALARVAPIINADNPDLSAFTRRGGKLIIYQGWDDPAITANSTIQYFEDVQRTIGREAAGQVRLFMVPGMMHCGGGPGTTGFDMQAALEKWIETGQVPDRIVASKPDLPPGSAPLTRPLCAWPKTAHYKGSGSTRDATNFACKQAR